VKVKYLKEEEIEFASGRLLRAYEEKFDLKIEPPVPLDEIVESLLELDIRLDCLATLLRRSNVLGAIWIEDKRIRIDDSLDPSVTPSKTGRYRFTLAHEVGHWELHRSYFLARSMQGGLFNQSSEPSVVCRAGDTEPIEWQANAFAAHLLMPKQMIFDAWEQLNGDLRPYNAAEEINYLSNKFSLGEERTPTVGCAGRMAQRFQVSTQAMQIRLTGVGLVQLTQGSSELFDKWAGPAISTGSSNN
jgi:hypothetical protein